jgi:tetratricopeptide (TPR) repeat protein
LKNVAQLYEAQGKDERAKTLYQQAIMLSQQAEGMNRSTADILYAQAQFHLDKSQYVEAEPLLRRAMVIYEKLLGPQDSSTKRAQQTFTWFYGDENQQEQAPSLSPPLLSPESRLVTLY